MRTWQARAKPCSPAGLPGGLHGAALRWAAAGGALRGDMQQHGHQVDAAQGCQVRPPSRAALQGVRCPARGSRRQHVPARSQLCLADLRVKVQPSSNCASRVAAEAWKNDMYMVGVA